MATVVDVFELGRALTLAALVGGVLDYAIVIRHRAVRRSDLRNDDLIRQFSLPALARVTLLDEQTQRPHRRRSLFRSHLFGRGPLIRRQVHLKNRNEPVWITRLKSH